MVWRITRLRLTLRGWGQQTTARLRKRPLLAACLLAAAVVALSAGPLAPSLYMNDDVAMAARVDGSTLGTPVPHIVFSNVIIGLVLSSLHNLAGLQSVPWYGIYLFTVHFTALAVIIYVVLSDRRPALGLRLLALAGWLAVFGLWMGTRITFTQVAFLLGAAGVFLYLARAPVPRTHWVTVAAAGTLLGAASLLRRHSVYAVMALSVVALLLAARRIPWRRQVLFAAVALGIALFGWVFQAAYYAGAPEWQQYLSLNRARGGLDSPAVRAAIDEQVLEKVGWTENDLAMFRWWMFADPDVYAAEDFEEIHRAVGSPSLPLGEALHRLGAIVRTSTGSLGLALTVGLFAAVWTWGGSPTRWFAGLSLLSLIGAAAVLLFLAEFPDRVALPMLGFVALLLLAAPEVVAPELGVRPGGWGGAVVLWLAALLSVAVSVAGLINAAVGADERRAADRGLDQMLAGFTELDPDGVFVARGGALRTGRRSPWHAPVLPSPALISLGWGQRSPVFDAQLAQAGIEDIYLAIGSREDVYFPLQEKRSATIAGHYLTYLEEHYGFRGLMRPKAIQGPYLIFDLAVDYEFDAQARVIIERRPDATQVVYPLDDRAMVGVVRLRALSGRLRVRGWAADVGGGGPVDHIVVFDGERAVDVLVPTAALDDRARQQAERLGVVDCDPLGFDLTMRNSSPARVRVFALSDGRATELAG